MASERELTISVADRTVSALYRRPRGSVALFVLAHGAGAGMRHPFLEAVSIALGEQRIATLRYQFPFMEDRSSGSRRPPDRAPILEATVRAAVSRGRKLARGIPLLAGGKSMGGRMTSRAAAERRLAGVDGIVFLGFPLHPAKREDKAAERAAHLGAISVPMLFVQGTRDALAGLARMRRLVGSLDHAALHIIRDGDHGFEVRKRSGRTNDEAIEEIASATAAWIASL